MNSNELLEEYKEYINMKAIFYTNRGFAYNEIFNEAYLLLLEAHTEYPQKTPQELKNDIHAGLMKYYRKETKERHITYGTSPENIYR